MYKSQEAFLQSLVNNDQNLCQRLLKVEKFGGIAVLLLVLFQLAPVQTDLIFIRQCGI
ncbi:7223_t:CDS:2, partial [Diversispora eburnea]